MYASGGLRWYLSVSLCFFAAHEWYAIEGTTLRYDRNVGSGAEVVPTDRYYQEDSGDKQVVRNEKVVNCTTHDLSGVINKKSTPVKNNDDELGAEPKVPSNTTSKVVPATLSYQRYVEVKGEEPAMMRSGTTPWYQQSKGERNAIQEKNEINISRVVGEAAFKKQDVIKGTTFKFRSNDLLKGTIERSAREIVDNGHAGEMSATTDDDPSQPSHNTTSQQETFAGRKIKMPKPNSQTMQYLLVPGFLMAGILPWVMPKLQMVVMVLSMVNNMAFTSALFTLIRNFIFDRETAQNVLYINNGYKKKNRHKYGGEPYKDHAPIQYDHQEYLQHPPGQSATQNHQEYQELQEHPPIRWETQGPSKFSEKWRRSSNNP